MTDWSKVFEVFGSGIVGVFLVMILLMVLTQVSTMIIDYVETWHKGKDVGKDAEPVQQVAAVKE